MDCKKCCENISFYIDLLLDDSEKAVFESHIETCEKCRTELYETQNLLKSLNEMPLAEPPERLHSDIMGRINAERHALKSQKHAFTHFGTVAACLVILIGVVSIMRSNGLKTASDLTGGSAGAVNSTPQTADTVAPEAPALNVAEESSNGYYYGIEQAEGAAEDADTPRVVMGIQQYEDGERSHNVSYDAAAGATEGEITAGFGEAAFEQGDVDNAAADFAKSIESRSSARKTADDSYGYRYESLDNAKEAYTESLKEENGTEYLYAMVSDAEQDNEVSDVLIDKKDDGVLPIAISVVIVLAVLAFAVINKRENS